jgi:hypothetical protein
VHEVVGGVDAVECLLDSRAADHVTADDLQARPGGQRVGVSRECTNRSILAEQTLD